MEHTSSASIKIAAAVALAWFAAVAYRDASQPVSLREAVAFEQFVYPSFRQVLNRHDADTSILAIVLTRRSVALLRLSEFSFRLPSVLAAGFFLWAVFRISRRLFGSGAVFLLAAATLSGIPLLLTPSATLPLAFWTWSLDRMLHRRPNSAALCLALSVAASLSFTLPALLLAAAFCVAVRMPAKEIVERFVFPLVAVAFVFLAIPLSTSNWNSIRDAARPRLIERPEPESEAVRSLVAVLHSRAAGTPNFRLAASGGVKPLVAFYRARYRFSNWQFLESLPKTGVSDYFVLSEEDEGLIAGRHLEVVAAVSPLLLARPVAQSRP